MAQQIWREYSEGTALLNREGYYDRLEECRAFYAGDQWRYLPTDGERLPIYNIIDPIVKYKTAVVAQNALSIRYTFDLPRAGLEQMTRQAAELLDRHARVLWEQNQMDRRCWEAVEDGCVTGSSYLYFYMQGKRLKSELLDGSALIFADEQEQDLNAQPYILIIRRRPVSVIRAEALANGVPPEEVERIQPDNEIKSLIGKENQLEEHRKCISILKFYKKDGNVCFTQSTRTCIYHPETVLHGVKRYPIVPFVWSRRAGSCRGRGAVESLIANQIAINKNLARMDIAIKRFAYPKLVYNAPRIQNVEDIEKIGASIAVDDPNVSIGELISYVQPASINNLAYNFMHGMISTTRELCGAGEAVTGQIDPEQASGAAIVAVREAAALNLNFAVAQFTRFVEEVAYVWYDLLRGYHPAGLELFGSRIPAGLMNVLEPAIRVDLSPANPFSKMAQEQALQQLLAAGHITFEEYVEALDKDAAVPREKLENIVRKRALFAANSVKMDRTDSENMEKEASS